MKSGIYLIVNNNNGRVYVGQSKNIKARIAVHKRKLKSGIHPNNYMMNDYNKYFGENFKFEILENCFVKNLDIREKYWISFLILYKEIKDIIVKVEELEVRFMMLNELCL